MPARLDFFRALAWSLALALLLQGCESRWVEIRDVGVLRLSEYWSRDRLDWEGGNTHVRRTTLCVRDTKRCVEDRLLTIDPDLEYEPPAPRWIHVRGIDDETLSRFLDTATGAELACAGCEGRLGGKFLPEIGGIRWSLSRDHAVTDYVDPAGKRRVFAWLGFASSGVTLRPIDPVASEGDRLIGPEISADGSTVAWYACGETCVLHAVPLREVTRGATLDVRSTTTSRSPGTETSLRPDMIGAEGLATRGTVSASMRRGTSRFQSKARLEVHPRLQRGVRRGGTAPPARDQAHGPGSPPPTTVGRS